MELKKVGEYSMRPKYRCSKCGVDLWTECSERTGWKEWLITKDGKRHFKSRCNL